MKILRLFLIATITCVHAHILLAQDNDSLHYFQWEALTSLPAVGNQAEALGVAGPVAGVHNNALIVAGGANFEKPYWESPKIWHDEIWVWENEEWMRMGKLDHPLAYNAVISSPLGVIALGGSDGRKCFDEVLLLKWNREEKKIEKELLPPLPRSCSYGSAALIRDVIYLAGGTETPELSTAMSNFWRLDLSNYGTESLQWELLPPWPGPSRAYNLTVAQHNGYDDCIYVMSGRKQGSQTDEWTVLTDVYEFNPGKYDSGKGNPWRIRAAMPASRMAGTAIGLGQSHIFVLSGADGSLYKQADSLRERHPGFPKNILAYHTITDRWFEAGEMPVNQLTSHVFKWEADIILASGEIKPRVRSPQIWKLSPLQKSALFGWINISAIVIYLLVLVAIGVYFSAHNRNTDDFFRGGQRIPWWAAGCSIFATMLSSLTFMSVPAKTYATDWLYFLINMCIVAVAPLIISFILPFFRRIDATSAYQYLELRFNLATRLFASASYILFQIGRMAIVMYLPSLALAAVTPLSIEVSILIMGILAIIYSTLGGVEAVIWTDTLQTFVLLGGALLSFCLIVFGPGIGLGEFYHTAMEYHKFRIVDWSWDYTSAVLWVVVLGGLGQTLIPYVSDQGVVQRYMSVNSEKKAAKSIWTNAGLSFIATLLFFCLGTALFVFYRLHPTMLDPVYQTDAVFPLFIAHQLPAGLAGLVVAGIFAAAQSTISTSMNSISTAVTTDFVRRLELLERSEKAYLRLARWLTVFSGLLGTGFALLIAYADIKSLWDSFIGILGLLGGAMCGLFLLGIFTKRANGKGALTGALAGAMILWLVQQFTAVSFLLYATIGIIVTFLIGWGASWLFSGENKELKGLTVFRK